MEPNIPVGSEAGVASGMKRATAAPNASNARARAASGSPTGRWCTSSGRCGKRPDRTTSSGGQFPRSPTRRPTRTVSPLLEPAPRTVRGARDLLSVALQYGNAFGQGLQAAALKPADFFGNDDVLYLMEDMATGEIRLSILWEWLHKNATLTADDEIGVKAGDRFTAELCARLLAEEYEKLRKAEQPRRPRRLEEHDAADRPGDRRDLRPGRRSSCRGTSTCSTSISTTTT